MDVGEDLTELVDPVKVDDEASHDLITITSKMQSAIYTILSIALTFVDVSCAAIEQHLGAVLWDLARN